MSSCNVKPAVLQLISDPVVQKIASNLQKSPAQILLRWAVQQNIGVLPKSSNPKHIAENFDIFSFELTSEDMASLSNLDVQYHYCWNPQSVL
ncbi:hypothetical protein FSP39_011284 [Pinctada imbricata]|uniref:NADP-dependent oxidoreductase domain-containing protein n=1 Tax=Pinctada imbricata TaxID=66713 RepID=A0AA89CAH8_PINIB|nr:hypothetical protein FSP39_011284 [Pinctada imbricata]